MSKLEKENFLALNTVFMLYCKYILRKEFVFLRQFITIMKIVYNFTKVICVAAALIISGFINISGGIALCFVVESENQVYSVCGICLFISSVLLIAASIFALLKKVLIPLIFNILGTACYIYTVSQIYSIPNTLIPKESTEPLAERHLITIIVTILLFVLTIFNFMDEKNVEKRIIKRQKKIEKQNRQLTEQEKIL